MKKVIVIIVVFGIIGLAFPLSNLVVGAPSGTSLSKAAAGRAEVQPVAAVLEAKCANCHTAEPKLPFYASFPLAKGMIQHDMDEGYRYFDLVGGLVPDDKAPPAEPALAMIEHVLAEGSMPPGKYLALHWDGGLSSKELAMLNVWIKSTRIKHYAPAEFSEQVKAAAVHPIPTKVTFDAAKAALGDKLYNDKRLSGDDTISCASCHGLDKGGTDLLPVSVGIRGQKGPINAPTVFNALWQVKQFWDGRAADLQEQAAGPPLNPIEMGGKWEDIVKKLNEDVEFKASFEAQYPEGFSEKTITAAIAEFERTLFTPGAPFDKYLLGQKDALSADAQKGWALFQKHACQTCHSGKLLGGGSFELMGRAKDYFAARGGKTTEVDLGRFGVTKKERDKRRFKVPTLRNIAKTFPYFHDGTVKDLAAAVKAMATYQNGVELSDAETKSLVAFLKSLTGTYKGKSI